MRAHPILRTICVGNVRSSGKNYFRIRLKRGRAEHLYTELVELAQSARLGAFVAECRRYIKCLVRVSDGCGSNFCRFGFFGQAWRKDKA